MGVNDKAKRTIEVYIQAQITFLLDSRPQYGSAKMCRVGRRGVWWYLHDAEDESRCLLVQQRLDGFGGVVTRGKASATRREHQVHLQQQHNKTDRQTERESWNQCPLDQPQHRSQEGSVPHRRQYLTTCSCGDRLPSVGIMDYHMCHLSDGLDRCGSVPCRCRCT